ncbi:uncharacterized protein LOC119727489 [Patiria miniata]|uniref:Uncharacterized protein n=1 Tax=Patiria miniata TaxID=46514 RepID=A0A913ZV00_PATMI|nr:uncharacterized protein LOC119727489 [Patiria miniata]
MAIMQRCCCFDNVRSGSIASGIYTLIYAAVTLALAAILLSLSWSLVVSGVQEVSSVFIILILVVLLCVLILISSILLLVGVSKDQRGYLFPYMIVMPILILLHVAYCILCIIGAAEIGSEGQGYSPYQRSAVDGSIAFLMIQLAICVLFTVMDVVCFLCVVSQYQELRDGRGRQQDIVVRATLITTTAPGFGGAVVVTQQGGVPPQNYAMQQGYAPQQRDAPQQGFGYAPMQEDFGPAQGYPAQQQYPQAI